MANRSMMQHDIAMLQEKAAALEDEVARRKQLERELSDFLESAAEGIHKMSLDGIILWANRAEIALLGYEPEEYIGHAMADFHVDRSVADDVLTRLRNGESLYNFPAQLRCKDGSVKRTLLHANVCLEDGQVSYVRCFMRDVTSFWEAEIVQARLAAIVDSSDDAIISKTLEGIITSWNGGAERMFGYTAEEAIGRPKTMLFPPERVSEEDEILLRLRRGERLHHFESIRRHKDGRDIDVSLSISPVKDSHGTIVGASTIARDITLSKQHYREVAALNEHLKRAMLETHHRVKNNLQIIAAMIDMQTADYDGRDLVPVSEFERLKSHICTLAIAHDLLTKGLKEDRDAQGLSTREVLIQLAPMLQQAACNHAIRFEVADVKISAKHCTSLALVVNELVSNALKHGKSRVEVVFSVNDRLAVLEVSDDGPGFPEGFNPASAANTGLDLVESLVRTDLAGQSQYQTRPGGGASVRVSFSITPLMAT